MALPPYLPDGAWLPAYGTVQTLLPSTALSVSTPPRLNRNPHLCHSATLPPNSVTFRPYLPAAARGEVLAGRFFTPLRRQYCPCPLRILSSTLIEHRTSSILPAHGTRDAHAPSQNHACPLPLLDSTFCRFLSSCFHYIIASIPPYNHDCLTCSRIASHCTTTACCLSHPSPRQFFNQIPHSDHPSH
jgi:hypothetical protein